MTTQHRADLIERLANLSDTECDFAERGFAGYEDGFALRAAAREAAEALQAVDQQGFVSREAVGAAIYRVLTQFPVLAGRVTPYHAELCAQAAADALSPPEGYVMVPVEELRAIWLEAHETIPQDGAEAAFASLAAIMHNVGRLLSSRPNREG